ncbi:hypothetical protein [Halomarina pelagica]|uniref:hypothetical protein n=1 Tax=Halomarina pelagica TaxID=2961599 RepID=UPI0020C39C8D|nr:hypothetical protein [Halomarina sp. BND7]
MTVGDSVSRRTLLAGVGATLLGAGSASAQENGSGNGTNATGDGAEERVDTSAIMPERPAGENTDYTGMFVHLTNKLKNVDVQGIEQCEVANWDPDETEVFEIQLVDKVGNREEIYGSSMYFPNNLNLAPGQLFVIDNQQPCTNGYLGVQLSEILAENVTRGFAGNGTRAEGEEGGGSSGAFGPGFGPVGALGGIAAVGYALARRAGGDE